jgi:hypothetical protein
VEIEALPVAGSGSSNSPPWTTIGGLALALGGIVLLYTGARLRVRAVLRLAQLTDPERTFFEALALFHASLEKVLAALGTRRQGKPKS